MAISGGQPKQSAINVTMRLVMAEIRHACWMSFDMVIVTTADRLYGQFGGEALGKERVIIELVGKFINSLPSE